mmetsp:Transcript_10024/g.21033  ORF Transcript_10024/g.21033 Transcript_10024/m.21033 type:complete len:292 (+) Transcript_10024:1529-2404(+)
MGAYLTLPQFGLHKILPKLPQCFREVVELLWLFEKSQSQPRNYPTRKERVGLEDCDVHHDMKLCWLNGSAPLFGSKNRGCVAFCQHGHRRHRYTRLIFCDVFSGWDTGFWDPTCIPSEYVPAPALLPPARTSPAAELSRAIRNLKDKEEIILDPRAATPEMVLVRLGHMCLVAELVDRSSTVPKVWLRPLMFVSGPATDAFDANPESDSISDSSFRCSEVWDLRACPYVILPNKLVTALDPDPCTWVQMLLVAHDAGDAISEENVASGTAQLFRLMALLSENYPHLFIQTQ